MAKRGWREKEKKFDEGLAGAVDLVAAAYRDHPNVKDDGMFFSADAARKAQEGIAEVRRDYGKEEH